MAKHHITPQGRILSCKKSPCKYRDEDHFTLKENATKVLQARKNEGFTTLALPKNANRLPTATKQELQSRAKHANSIEDLIHLGECFYQAVITKLPFGFSAPLSLLQCEELEVALQKCFLQVTSPAPGKSNITPEEDDLTFLPRRVKTFLKKERVSYVPARKADMALHGLHALTEPMRTITAVTEEEGLKNIWVKEKKTGKSYWWGEPPKFADLLKVGNSVRIVTPSGGRLLTDGNLYSDEESPLFTVFALPRDKALRDTFLLHQVTHLLAARAVLPSEEAFARWATVRRYSRSEATAVWHGFPLDQMGMSPEELLPTLSEALFFPTKQNFHRLYGTSGEIHEALYFIAGLWLTIAHQKLTKS